jgi:hypothetical protein
MKIRKRISMTQKEASGIFLLLLFAGVSWFVKADEISGLQDGIQKVTLFSRLGHKEKGLGKSAFSFKHGLRSDSEEWLPVTRNCADLMYGSISLNGDSDWFCVSMGGENPSKIKDMGALEWSDIKTVPVLPATAPTMTGIRFPDAGEPFEVSSQQRVTKAVVGHLYVAHIKSLYENLNCRS